MPLFCSECGTEIKDGSKFCPNCGKKAPLPKFSEEKSYEELIKEIILIKENGTYRISKAKSVGALLFVFIIVGSMFSVMPSAVRMGFFALFINVLVVFIPGLVWYSICRLGGYLIRNYLIK